MSKTKLEGKAMEGAKRPGLTFDRFYTTPEVNPLDAVKYEKRHIKRVNNEGEIYFGTTVKIPQDIKTKYCIVLFIRGAW